MHVQDDFEAADVEVRPHAFSNESRHPEVGLFAVKLPPNARLTDVRRPPARGRGRRAHGAVLAPAQRPAVRGARARRDVQAPNR